MGSVIRLEHHRSAALAPTSAAVPRSQEDDESWRALLVLVVVFTATAIAMSIAVVVAGSNSWAEAMPLIVFVAVFGLTKVFLANALFYVMIRSDAQSKRTAAALKNTPAGLVIRRPAMPPGLKRPKIAGAHPRKTGPASKVRLAITPRRNPSGPPPSRNER